MFKKYVFILVASVGIQLSAQAQIIFPGNNTVKVGTNAPVSSPVSALEFVHSTFGSGYGSKIYPYAEGNGLTSLRFAVRGNTAAWTDALYIKAADNGGGGGNLGYIGVGTVTPLARLHTLNGTSPNYLRIGFGGAAEGYNGEMAGIIFTKHYDLNQSAKIYTYGDFATSGHQGADLRFATNQSGNDFPIDRMVIKYNGNVGIGTTTPGNFKLAVEGKIGARSIQVTTVNPWPDYVFANTYKLKPLAEVAQYIQANKHLPEVPSAQEVEKEGIDVAAMDAILLKKIEELTLYMIEQNKQLQELKQENVELKKEIENLK